MADYSAAQLKAMEEEAARRVMEMNRRSKSHVMQSNSAAQKNERPQENRHKSQTQNEPKGRGAPPVLPNGGPPKNGEKMPAHHNPLNFLRSLDLKQLISGGEQSMLLLLIMILMSDNSDDDFLIYALIYIML